MDMKKITFEHNLNTAGDGLWSDQARKVATTYMETVVYCLESSYGELRVYFDTDTWKVHKHGLIYTDERFIAELRQALTQHGLAGHDAYYSEQGMQGNDYVSLDINAEFVASWQALGYESLK
jgi:hypothetical protein